MVLSQEEDQVGSSQKLEAGQHAIRLSGMRTELSTAILRVRSLLSGFAEFRHALHSIGHKTATMFTEAQVIEDDGRGKKLCLPSRLNPPKNSAFLFVQGYMDRLPAAVLSRVAQEATVRSLHTLSLRRCPFSPR